MVGASSYPHIEADEKGTLRIGMTRYEVLYLAAEHYHLGWSLRKSIRHLATSTDHYQSMLAQMNEFNERGEERVRRQTLTREQLLQRRNTSKE